MINATETSAATGAAGAQQGTHETADAELFVQELRTRLGDGAAIDAMARGMARLAGAFPDLALTVSSFGDFAGTASYFINIDDATTLTVSPSMVAKMADDDDIFARIRDVVAGLFSAGESQDLVDVGGETTTRNVVVDEAETRYVEVQRDANGRALAITSLLLETQKLISNTLEWLMALRQSGGREGMPSSLAEYYFSMSASSANSWGFNGIASSTTSWQLEGIITGAGLAGSGSFSGQRMSTRMEIVIEQWEIETDGTVDLFTYMQIMGLTDPLVFDLDGEGINLTSVEDGVYFDIRGDGTPVKTGWISGNNAFLFLDQNGNGIVDDANELFGDHGGFANGFEKLAQYDDNGDGVIDENDAIWSELRLWRDLNGDGICDEGETMTLAEAGIKSINLRYSDERELDQHGNVIGEKSTYTKTDGSEGLVADAWFRNR